MQHVFSFFQPESKFFYFSTSSYELESLNHFLEPEQLTGGNCWSCPQCSSYKECTRESSFKTCASILIIRLRRFTYLSGSLFKDNRVVNCYIKSHPTLFHKRMQTSCHYQPLRDVGERALLGICQR